MSEIKFVYYRLVYIYGKRGRRGRDRMVVVCEFESRSGELYKIQHYVIKFVSDLRRLTQESKPKRN
jgi:hypothetical protein